MVVAIQLVWGVSLMAYKHFVDYGGSFVPQIKGAKGGGKGGSQSEPHTPVEHPQSLFLLIFFL